MLALHGRHAILTANGHRKAIVFDRLSESGCDIVERHEDGLVPGEDDRIVFRRRVRRGEDPAEEDALCEEIDLLACSTGFPENGHDIAGRDLVLAMRQG
ncbi:MAG: hypothetical protein SPH79_06770 [Schaalia hyovaginalis]|nr:hypothetical protein [Schaalia hyovaginalis]MCI7672654.1 hypothetical protein [Schaalia hyovaginalis]MDY5506729.1 hypothetical protein [Schaalia hyovaginalis]MDY5600177.1 hypothetical protein [Schaalia hyovaginalis]MDY6214178.1 hypothetical protein [Schaalia hyovaginalis]